VSCLPPHSQSPRFFGLRSRPLNRSVSASGLDRNALRRSSPKANMSTIRVVWGPRRHPRRWPPTTRGPPRASSNLVSVSSVIPAETRVEAVGTAPDLGPAGERLTVVEARATTAGPGRVRRAGLGAIGRRRPGPVLRDRGRDGSRNRRTPGSRGLAAGQELRDWQFADPRAAVESRQADSGRYTTAVVPAVYGDSEPILGLTEGEPF